MIKKSRSSVGAPLKWEKDAKILYSEKLLTLTQQCKSALGMYVAYTWSVCSQKLKQKCVKIDILDISRVRWPRSEQQITHTGHIYFSEENDPRHQDGVAILVLAQTLKSSSH